MTGDKLIFISGIFRYEDSLLLNQARIIPVRNQFIIKDPDHCLEEIKKFVDTYFPYMERKFLCNPKQKGFYSFKKSFNERGEKNEK